MTEQFVDSLMAGAVDMHIHSSPDASPRKMSDLEVARSYKEGGLKAVLLKCHVTPTAGRAAIAGQATGNFNVFGGLVLNRMAGGLNPAAVDAELALGAKQIWMPTLSSELHIKINKGNPANAVRIKNEKGALKDELFEILDLIAAKDAILGTGHLTSDECEQVVELALKRGVKKILITHPEYEMPAMPADVQKKLARKGVMFERCFFAANPVPGQQVVPPSVVAGQIRAVGAEMSIMASDFGQFFNEEPLKGFRRFITTMLGMGIPEGDIEVMIKKNPEKILGI
jgi:hypothetical protein